MATKVNINGKITARPGVYALTKSGIKTVSPQLAYGNVTIIDDGIGASWGGGVGGTAYTFDNIQDFRDFVKGGELWNIALPLFKPLQGVNGASKVTYIPARVTTPASIILTIAAGLCTFVSKDQGLNANGAQDAANILRTGYAATLSQASAISTGTSTTTTPTSPGVSTAQVNRVVVANVVNGVQYTITQAAQTVTYKATASDTPATVHAALAALINANSTLSAIVTATVASGVVITANVVNTPFTQTSGVIQAAATFVFSFWHGSFKGTDPLNNTPYEGVTSDNADPILIAQSTAVSTLDDLAAWVAKSSAMQTGFIANIGTGSILSSDLSANTGNKLASGGTESYSGAAYTAAINVAKVQDTNFFLSDKYGVNAIDANNDTIVSSILATSKYGKFLVIGGGATNNEFDSISVPAAKHFNDDGVILVHGDGKKTIRAGFKRVSSFYKAAAFTGRLAGLEPQVPATWKNIGIDAEYEDLSDTQLDAALTYGVLATKYDDELGYNIVLEDVNTLQQNDNLVNDDASSFNIALKRITAQLNKELSIYLKKKFFGKQSSGPNRNTVTEQDLVAAASAFLQSRIASTIDDNLIISFANVVATRVADNYYVSYEFQGNTEISKIIITGTIVDNG